MSANYVALGCYATISITSIIIGSLVSTCLDIFCGVGYMLTGVTSGASFFVFKHLKVAKDIEVSLNAIKDENSILKHNNKQYKDQNDNLQNSNKKLSLAIDGLQNDLKIFTDCVAMYGKNTSEFMSLLRTSHERLKHENDRHEELNWQQAKFQVLQIFKHLDANNDFLLSAKEMKGSQHFLKSVFPLFDVSLLDGTLTYVQLLNIIMPKSNVSLTLE